MSKMYLVKPDGIDAEWNATNYGENEYTQLSMKMIRVSFTLFAEYVTIR